MAGPWENYAQPETSTGSSPWDKYGSTTPAPSTSVKAPSRKGSAYEGLGEAALEMGTGLLGKVAGDIGGLAATGKEMISPTPGGGDPAGFKQSIQEGMTYQPRTELGQAASKYNPLAAIGRGVDYLGGQAEKVTAPTIGGTAAAGLREGINQGAGFLGVKGAPKVPGIIAEVPKVAGRAVESVGKTLTPTITPEVQALAQKASQMGIPLRPDMLMNNKLFKIVGDALENAPLTGDKLEGRRVAYNKAIIDQIGGDTKSGKLDSTTFRNAIDKSGSKIGELSEKHPIPMDEKLQGALTEHAKNAAFEVSDVEKIVHKYTAEIADHAKEGVIDGTTFRKIRSKIGEQMRRTKDGDVRHALGELDDTMLDSIQSQLSPEELGQFNEARGQYARAKLIEPLVADSLTGDIRPDALMGRLNATGSGKRSMAMGYAGDMGDLAKIGKLFLKEPTKTQSTLGLGLMGAGAVTSPPAIAGAYGAAQLYNRLGPSIAKKMIGPPK